MDLLYIYLATQIFSTRFKVYIATYYRRLLFTFEDLGTPLPHKNKMSISKAKLLEIGLAPLPLPSSHLSLRPPPPPHLYIYMYITKTKGHNVTHIVSRASTCSSHYVKHNDKIK